MGADFQLVFFTGFGSGNSFPRMVETTSFLKGGKGQKATLSEGLTMCSTNFGKKQHFFFVHCAVLIFFVLVCVKVLTTSREKIFEGRSGYKSCGSNA
jgi:hypothetical protein